MAITAKAAGMYYLATGDMDAFDLMAAHADFLTDTASFRDGSEQPVSAGRTAGATTGARARRPLPSIRTWPTPWAWAPCFSRRSQFQSDAEDMWPLCTNKADWVYLGYLMEAANDPRRRPDPAGRRQQPGRHPGQSRPDHRLLDRPRRQRHDRHRLALPAQVQHLTAGRERHRLARHYPAAAADRQPTGRPVRPPSWPTQRPFVHGTNVLSLPTPAVAGTSQSKTVTGLTTGTRYYFAIKTLDAAGNLSDISNVVNAVAP